MITRMMSEQDRHHRALGAWDYYEIVNRRGRLVAYALGAAQAREDARAILQTTRRCRELRAWWTQYKA